MKLLIYSWSSFLQQDIYMICKESGISYDVFPWEFKDKNVDDEFEKWFANNVTTSLYDGIFSVNYWPMLSKVAQKNNINISPGVMITH